MYGDLTELLMQNFSLVAKDKVSILLHILFSHVRNKQLNKQPPSPKEQEKKNTMPEDN